MSAILMKILYIIYIITFTSNFYSTICRKYHTSRVSYKIRTAYLQITFSQNLTDGSHQNSLAL